MKLTAVALTLLLAALLPATGLLAQSSRPRIEKEPSWITSLPVNYLQHSLDAEAEDGVVDLAFEQQVSLAEEAEYCKKAVRLLTEAGVQNNAQVSVSFDPSYQQLVFHSLCIVRNGQVLNRLDPARMKTIQQEKDLDRSLYDGSLTTVIFPEDVRNGDVLEYSYTLKGFNPIFRHKYSGSFTTRFSVPVYRVLYRLVAPAGRPVHLKNCGAVVAPAVAANGQETAYTWNLENVPPLHPEESLPEWFDPYPSVEVSEFSSWKEVSDWALELYPFPKILPPGLQQKVASLQKAYPSSESRLLAALRFVQDDIRYLGIEMGPHSHRPHDPGRILAQRFGDCKDKSYLLCLLLRGLGIEAWPVLINTSAHHTLNDRLPAPSAFDHVTVAAKLAGRMYWFDPTISYQRGPLGQLSFPDYGAGLVVSPTTTGLTAIPFRPTGGIDIKEVFQVPDMSGSARLVVTTRYTGAPADDIRSDFNTSSRNQMLQSFLEYYQSYFESMTADSILTNDDAQTGTFTTVEYYTLQNFWGAENSFKKLSLEPYVIRGALRRPKQQSRTMPFALPFPTRFHEEIEINLPEAWDLEESSEEVSCPSFILRSRYTCSGRRMILRYDYENRKDHVLPTEAAAYFASLKKADEQLAYDITSTEVAEVTDGSALSQVQSNLPALYVLLALCVAITAASRKRKTGGW
ncbi:DUF3857 domain-containing protein [Paraflavisolibacter sp. H34]|uniref:DUF3857 domain-containing protein n=1 Tax=Huijunlia imazamoxiresistens TaxID=3127457 RepID=UPI00301B2302